MRPGERGVKWCPVIFYLCVDSVLVPIHPCARPSTRRVNHHTLRRGWLETRPTPRPAFQAQKRSLYPSSSMQISSGVGAVVNTITSFVFHKSFALRYRLTVKVRLGVLEVALVHTLLILGRIVVGGCRQADQK